MNWEDRYLDVMQNIEFALVTVYRLHPEMTDWDAIEAVKGLIRTYKAERDGRAVSPPQLNPLAQKAYESVKEICEWRMGRQPLKLERETEHGREPFTVTVGERTVPLSDMIACLQKILNSIERWNKRMGRRGYFEFVSQFL